tara:strand:- start:194 stop:478 length:285 start_codon:yes stop_codon:yes gene_type:complete
MGKPMKVVQPADPFVMPMEPIVLNVWATPIVLVRTCLNAWMALVSSVELALMRGVRPTPLSVLAATVVLSVRVMQTALIQAGPAAAKARVRPVI